MFRVTSPDGGESWRHLSAVTLTALRRLPPLTIDGAANVACWAGEARKPPGVGGGRQQQTTPAAAALAPPSCPRRDEPGQLDEPEDPMEAAAQLVPGQFAGAKHITTLFHGVGGGVAQPGRPLRLQR